MVTRKADAVVVESHIPTRRREREDTPWMMKRGENQRQENFRVVRCQCPPCMAPLGVFDPMLRRIFVLGLAASAEAFQPVGAARVRGTSFAPTAWRRASPAVALELRGEHAKSAWRRLAFVSPRPLLPRACVRRATVSATQLGYARTTCAFVLIQA